MIIAVKEQENILSGAGERQMASIASDSFANAITEQQVNTEIQIPFIPKTSKEAGLMVVPILVSAMAFGFREVVVARIKARANRQAAEIELQKLEQKEKSDRIEYLEKQNQMLLNEILDLRRSLQMSGPLSLSMYDPGKLNNSARE